MKRIESPRVLITPPPKEYAHKLETQAPTANVITAEIVDEPAESTRSAALTLYRGTDLSRTTAESHQLAGKPVVTQGNLNVLSPALMQKSFNTQTPPFAFLGQVEASPVELMQFLLSKGFKGSSQTPRDFILYMPRRAGQDLRAQFTKESGQWHVVFRHSYRVGDRRPTDTYKVRIEAPDEQWYPKLRKTFRKKMPAGWFP